MSSLKVWLGTGGIERSVCGETEVLLRSSTRACTLIRSGVEGLLELDLMVCEGDDPVGGGGGLE